jgi:hypothetical protein
MIAMIIRVLQIRGWHYYQIKYQLHQIKSFYAQTQEFDELFLANDLALLIYQTHWIKDIEHKHIDL